ncbi:MAG TPA: acyl-CoA dehydrogenase family protein, partial [Dehalococcoidia bacterium]|nr:acyl-CoA dehydrogenase family protein [Dehalococcoidia bacterium]
MTASTDWVAVAKELGPLFAQRAAAHDADDSFVADNYADLKAHGVFAAGVPADLGGGGAGVDELAAMLREYAHYCSSTALALSMHTHLIAVPTWRRVHEQAPVEGLLKRVAAEQIVLVSTGAGDWLDSNGTMVKVDGGYRYTGRKSFASGSPAGSLLITSGLYEDPTKGRTVFHFPVPLDAPGVKVLDNWRTLGMRGTGSNDVIIEDVFVLDQAAGSARKQGAFGVLHTVVLIALPLIYSVYVGIAEAARDIALQQAAKKRDLPDVQFAVGEMENHLRSAQIALASAIEIACSAKPGPETSSEVLIRRTLAGEGAIRTVEKAIEVVGGASFFRSLGLERLWRDVQGA